MGGQASWLIPAALIAMVAGVVARRRAPRTDRVRAALLLWGGWLLVTGVVFSYGQGVIHTYYTVALAPAIAALVAIGGRQFWALRTRLWARMVAAGAVVATAAWAWALLERTPSWDPALRIVIAVAACVAAAGLLAAPVLRRAGGAVLLALVLVAGLAGPAAYAADTITSGHTGSVPSAGPASAQAFGGGGALPTGARQSGTSRTGAPPGGATAGRTAPTGTGPTGTPRAGTGPTGAPGTSGASGAGSAPTGAGGGGTTSLALAKALESGAGQFRWVAATSGSQSAATLELATGGDPVMAIGGFNNQGGNLSLATFKTYVAKGEIHYYIAGSTGGGPGGGNSASAITTWVEAHYKATTIGGVTVYNLTTPVGTS